MRIEIEPSVYLSLLNRLFKKHIEFNCVLLLGLFFCCFTGPVRPKPEGGDFIFRGGGGEDTKSGT